MWKALNSLPKGWLQKHFNPLSSSKGPTVTSEPGTSVARHVDVCRNDAGVFAGGLQSAAIGVKPPPFRFTDKPPVADTEPVHVAPFHLDSQWREKIDPDRKWRPGHQYSNEFFDFLGFGFFMAAGLRLSMSGYFRSDERKKENKKCGHDWNPLASTLLSMAFVRPGIGLQRMVLPVVSLARARPTSDESADEVKYDGHAPSHTSTSLADHVNRLQDLACQYTAIVLNSDALRLIDENDWSKAVECLLQASELGLDKAFFNLGICHELGRGVKQDFSKACQYYRKAAEVGHTSALYNLAVFNLEGRGVPIDEAEGLKWMEKASDGGVKEAQTFLGLHCYQNGEYEKAVSFFEMAVEQKHADAEYFLGLCYANGLGVEVDAQRAACLFEKSANAGNAEACYTLATFYETGIDGLPHDSDLATELFRRAATLGHPLAVKKCDVATCKSSKPDGLRAVSSLPDLELLHQKNKIQDRQVPKNSCSVFDLKNIKELLRDYWKFDNPLVGRREDCVLVSERQLLSTKTLLA